ncbi:MAG: hypothetical protein ACOYNL_02220 [Rickettsiales bacterium]
MDTNNIATLDALCQPGVALDATDDGKRLSFKVKLWDEHQGIVDSRIVRSKMLGQMQFIFLDKQSFGLERYIERTKAGSYGIQINLRGVARAEATALLIKNKVPIDHQVAHGIEY